MSHRRGLPSRPFRGLCAPKRPTGTVSSPGLLAEFCGKHLKKGQRVYTEGRLAANEYEDREGVRHRDAQINAREVLLLTQRQSKED